MTHTQYYIERKTCYVAALNSAPDTSGYGANAAHFSDENPHNLVTSIVENTGSEGSLHLHAPTLDIDVPCELLPSSQPGHYHLYIHKAITWSYYKKLLIALSECGIIEVGYKSASINRGFSSLRMVGDHKPGIKHPASSALKENALLKRQNFLLSKEVEALKEQLAQTTDV